MNTDWQRRELPWKIIGPAYAWTLGSFTGLVVVLFNESWATALRLWLLGFLLASMVAPLVIVVEYARRRYG